MLKLGFVPSFFVVYLLLKGKGEKMSKKKKEPKDKAHVMKNTLFILKCSLKSAPLYLFLIYFAYILENVYYSFVLNVLFLKTALEIIEGNGSFSKFALTIAVIVSGKLIVDIIGYVCNYYIRIRFEIKCEGYINSLLFKKAREVELGCYETPEFFDSFTRATWVVEKNGFKRITEGTAWIIGSVISLASLLVYLYSVDPRMLIFVACPFIVMFFSTKRNNEDFKMEKTATPTDREAEYVRRTVLLKDFAKEIKTTDIFTVLSKRYKDAVNRKIEILKKYGIKIAFWEACCDIFGEVIPVAGGFCYSAYRLAVEGNISLADFSVLFSAVLTCRGKINNISYYIAQQQKHCLWVQSMREFLSYEPKLTDGEREAGDFETLEFRNVSFTYPDAEKPTLKNVSFKMSNGDTFAVVGHNGAGKTTLSKLIMRLYDVSEGQILYNGIDIREYTLKSYRERFAGVFQDYKIFAMTVAENVLMEDVDSENVKRAEAALTQSGVIDKINTLKNGINTMLTKEFDDEGASFSGGEGQKIAIARLFAENFQIAVLDEPSSALDPVAEAAMYNALTEVTSGKGVIYISHRLSSAAGADRILVFKDGCLIEQGSHEELLELNGEYREMFMLQASGYREEENNLEE